jgi:hypothetical protein
MAQAYNGFSSYRLFAGGYQAAAGFCAGLAEAARRRAVRPASANDLSDSEDRFSRQHVSGNLPGSVFDPRYEGLTAQAASLDAAICRRQRLR